MKDQFSAHVTGPTAPAEHADVTMRLVLDDSVVLAGLPGATIHPLWLRQVLATGTSTEGLTKLS